MNFSTLREYFYKLANRCYLLVLVPLFVFIYLYHLLESQQVSPMITRDTATLTIFSAAILIAIINLTTVHWVSLKRLRLYRLERGLGNKLDRYAEVVQFRMMACSISSLLMAGGLLLTGLEWFALSYIVILCWILALWPTSSRACRALKLKGAEYEMVYFKKDKI